MSLSRRARELYPDSRRLAAKWLLAYRDMQQRRKLILAGAPAKWGRVERRQQPRHTCTAYCVEITIADRFA
jgi:hypothetical protein